MPPDATVRFLGDGKFDGTGLQAVLRREDWQNVCRIASNVLVKACGVQFRWATWGYRAANWSRSPRLTWQYT